MVRCVKLVLWLLTKRNRYKVETLTKKKFLQKDFKGLDLSGQDLSHSEFILCNFEDTNLSNADCSHSVFTGSKLKNTKCTHTNFMKSRLDCYFHPSDAYGMTLTLECRTFKGMVISRLWWYGYVYFAMLMLPEKDKGKDLHDAIIQAFGTERYLKIKALFAAREI